MANKLLEECIRIIDIRALSTCNSYDSMWMRNVLYFLKQYQKIEGSSWIPCEERLPEKSGDYLCTTYHAIPPYNLFHPENDIYVYDMAVKEFDGKSFGRSVIAWMPLPEPYTKRGDSNE